MYDVTVVAYSHYSWCHGTVTVFLLYCWATYVGVYIKILSVATEIRRVACVL